MSLPRSALLLAASLSLACGRPVRPDKPAADAQLQLGDAWFPARAASLHITPEQARARDAAITDKDAPAESWDPFMREQASLAWETVCASCHGVDGKGTGVQKKFAHPPRAFGGMGMRMGFTFGGDKMRAGLFRKVMKGGQADPEKPGEMPAMDDGFPRELGWAMVHYVESL